MRHITEVTMLSLHRIALPSINAIFVTIGLLYSMFLLVDINEPELMLKQKNLNIEWTKVPEDTDPVMKIIKPIKPVEVVEPPQLLVEDPEVTITIEDGIDWNDYIIKKEPTNLVDLNGSQLVLAIAFPPVYPTRLIARGVEGYVVVGFSVASSGAVYDPHVIESEPKGVFDNSALKAIMKFKYKPKVVDGKPVNTEGQRYMFTYKMDS